MSASISSSLHPRSASFKALLVLGVAVLWTLLSLWQLQKRYYKCSTTNAIQTAADMTSFFANLTFQAAALSNLTSTLGSFSIAAPTDETSSTPPVLKPHVKDFEKQPGVVVVTKIHGPEYMGLLKQQYCLFSAAYNWKMQYDIVLFATEEIGEANRKELADIVHPANFTVYIDEKSLADHVSELDEKQTAYLAQRCKVNSTDYLTWRTRCSERGSGVGLMPLAYTWQCEFRSKWIWRHPGLAPYKYMMWIDSDAMCAKAWKQDPVAAMVRNDLVLLYDNYPLGFVKGGVFQDRIQRSFNKTLCRINVVDGHFEPQYGDCWENTAIGAVHGFFHLTNLDFFRSPPVQKWVDIYIGDTKFSRKFDDQIVLSIPTAILAPNRSWDMWDNGINLTVFHNGMLDGKIKWRGGFFRNYWRRMGKTEFPEAHGKCQITTGG